MKRSFVKTPRMWWIRHSAGYLSLGVILSVTMLQACQETEVVQVFFFLVNQSGAEVQIRVSADGRELFARRMEARAAPSEGVRPGTGEHPAVELKIAVPKRTNRLEVSDLLHLGVRKSVEIRGFTERDAGFRIVITRAGIEITQDYYPIR